MKKILLSLIACLLWASAGVVEASTKVDIALKQSLDQNGKFSSITFSDDTVQTTAGGGGGAPTNATYITQTPDGTLSQEQALSALSSGIMRVATTTGVVTSLTDSSGILANISDETGTGVMVFSTTPTFTTSIILTPLASPTTSTDGEFAIDTDGWGTGYDAVEFFNGTASAYIVATTASDTPTNGQVPKWNTGGTITWEDDAGSAGGDSISIDSVAVVDPDFQSGGDIDFVDTANVVTANINAGVIVNADINGSAAIAASKIADAYIINSGSDVLSGTLTSDGITIGANELITLGAQTILHDGTNFVFNDDVTGVSFTTTGADLTHYIAASNSNTRSTAGAVGDAAYNATTDKWEVSDGATADARHFVFDEDVASVTASGVVELATTAEIDTGTDSTRAMPVDQFVASKRNIRYIDWRVVEAATDTAVDTSITGDFEIPISGTIVSIGAYVDTAGTTGTMTIDVNIAGTTIMTTNKITIDTTEKSSRTAATAPALTTTATTAGDIFTVDIDAIHTTAAKGCVVRFGVRE